MLRGCTEPRKNNHQSSSQKNKRQCCAQQWLAHLKHSTIQDHEDAPETAQTAGRRQQPRHHGDDRLNSRRCRYLDAYEGAVEHDGSERTRNVQDTEGGKIGQQSGKRRSSIGRSADVIAYKDVR
jgi:hypothetical protein